MAPSSPAILAENFQGLDTFLLSTWLILIALAGASLWPAARGHWAGPAVAAPAVGLGLLFSASLLMARAPGWIMLLSLIPVAAGFGSISMWSGRRRGTGGQ